jgi:carboxynorspermidine decarboxylase
MAPFLSAVELLRSKYNVRVFIEPGSAVVRESGSLASSVVDLFHSDGKVVAVLDTTVNHAPELFEYQCPPEVVGAQEGGRFAYLLVGGTCLAGDVFGEFAFDEPLEVGSRIIFAKAGAYTFVKAHTFNGINLPTIYTRKVNGDLVMQTQFGYEDFARRNGVENHVLV